MAVVAKQCQVRARLFGLQFRQLTFGLFAIVGMLFALGCDRASPPIDSITPARSMRKLAERGQWEEAWELRDAVLAKHPDDPETLVLLAKVAHSNDLPGNAADFLRDACVSETYQSPSRVKQAVVALIQVGRLLDAMELLTKSLESHPDQHANRRWLYDFCMGIEDRRQGLRHARYLIRKRQIDVDLLLSMSNTESRTMESEPLFEMSRLNPIDKRPLMGLAKRQYDKNEFDECVGTLKAIGKSNPKFAPAFALHCAALSQANQHDQLASLVRALPEGMGAEVWFWIAMGNDALTNGKPQEAARAFWEATRQDVDLVEPWEMLHKSLVQIDEKPSGVTEELVLAIEKRANMLKRFTRARARFLKAGKISRELALEAGIALRDLGRLWEAEAWASIAVTLPEDNSVPLDEFRENVVAELRLDTPWQQREPFSELVADLSSLPLPELATRTVVSP